MVPCAGIPDLSLTTLNAPKLTTTSNTVTIYASSTAAVKAVHTGWSPALFVARRWRGEVASGGKLLPLEVAPRSSGTSVRANAVRREESVQVGQGIARASAGVAARLRHVVERRHHVSAVVVEK